MSTTEPRAGRAAGGARAGSVDLKLEVVVIPVSDVDRAKEFYGILGWRLDADFAFDNGFRVVQYTPPGSACSAQFGPDMTTAPPGSAQNMYLIVADIEAARADLVALGAQVTEVFHPAAPGAQFRADPAGHAPGPAPERATYSSFVTFSDPDGNTWLLQEVTTRLPGRIDAAETAFRIGRRPRRRHAARQGRTRRAGGHGAADVEEAAASRGAFGAAGGTWRLSGGSFGAARGRRRTARSAARSRA